jgi:hypothetical protein
MWWDWDLHSLSVWDSETHDVDVFDPFPTVEFLVLVPTLISDDFLKGVLVQPLDPSFRVGDRVDHHPILLELCQPP